MSWDLPKEAQQDSAALAARIWAEQRVVVIRRRRLCGRRTYEVVPYRWYRPRHAVSKLAAWRFERRFGRD